ncbi:putative U2 small nuclear ribonucleoprotein A' [Babesia bovis T2Bo]|uniref:U2 small nuclear ribonucleoprotein A', putative n=1 Tax=Babesia bovis TaxID=5865 RepID=A7AR14_BABBO|nr:putative U2 small nuclear ribonucleoprotein A' [Babesia bovis T2Bo]EDO06983.1 putative U2 small nuclear ribonucleoprotein A' [Babesia bovis T2Bo]|eukprot:XP_001610551.1 U2 small nuclear ribonucleoprotein A' [Babesia bovis T2Bo]
MELKLEHIYQGRQSLSPSGDRTISMRDLRVTTIANLGATRDGYDCIDISNNEIRKLENFPLLPRLRTLIVAGNRISKISEDFATSLPNLTSLVLTGNNITHLKDISPIFSATKLERLSLLNNPVTALPNFRYYVLYRLPLLRFLNFSKVTNKEREMAASFFRTADGISMLRELGYEFQDSDALNMGQDSITPVLDKTNNVSSLLQIEERLLDSMSEMPSAT